MTPFSFHQSNAVILFKDVLFLKKNKQTNKKKQLDSKIPNTLFNIQWRKMMILSYSQEQ